MKKGFTIVELMTTIVILAIVTVIGVNSYRGINIKIKETSYENKIKLIETKAEEYASRTGYLATNVDNLVKEGYIEADDEEGNVKDPRDGKIMNCHIVNVREEGENVYGEYTEEEECDNSKVEVVNMHLGIQIKKESDRREIENNQWVGENVILEAYFKDENVKEEEVKKITWSSNAGREEKEVNGDFAQKKEYSVKAEQIINTGYSVRIEMNTGVVYQAQVVVKIDKQRPNVYEGETDVEKEGEYTREGKEISISASDGNGSGIYGYYIGSSNRCKEVNYERTENNVYKKKVEEGTYYVCVRDKVGNVSEDISSKRIVVDKIDKTAPTCELEAVGTMGTNNYFTSDVSIRFKKAEDRESGVNHTLIDKPNITEDTNGVVVTGTVVDNVGNSGTCQITIKMDKTKPTCSLKASGTKGANEWYIGNIGISFASLEDNKSGVMTSGIERTSITENTSGVTIKGKVKDKAGNENTCEIRVKKDSETPRIEVVNNPLNLNSDPYDFKNNTRRTYGISGGLIEFYGGASGMAIPIDKSIECNPSMSLGTGSYQVTCEATGGNGLSSSTTFQVNHSYPAYCREYILQCHYLRDIGCRDHNGRPHCYADYLCDDGSITQDVVRYQCESSQGCPNGWGGAGEHITIRNEHYCTCPNGGTLDTRIDLCTY